MTASYGCVVARYSPSSPSCATSAAKPLLSSANAIDFAREFSSSTTKIRMAPRLSAEMRER